jgi:hypothetical protein
VPNTLPVFKQPVGAAYQQNFDFRAGTGALEHWCGTIKASLKLAPSSLAFEAE